MEGMRKLVRESAGTMSTLRSAKHRGCRRPLLMAYEGVI